jgi:acetyltransferase-like isoleucine patch superfamily enzyme
MISSFCSRKELKSIGLKNFGSNVLISRKASIYNPSTIELGSYVRIDDFCILSGIIKIGSHVHISAYSALYGKYGIELEDFSGLSPRCTIFSASDDFGGDYLIGPMVDSKYTNVIGGKVILKKYSQIGAGCVVLPNITIGEGVAVGAMSLVTRDLEDWTIFLGIPARFHKKRSKKVLSLNS